MQLSEKDESSGPKHGTLFESATETLWGEEKRSERLCQNLSSARPLPWGTSFGILLSFEKKKKDPKMMVTSNKKWLPLLRRRTNFHKEYAMS